MSKKYKLILLKDLPNYKVGTTVLNISQEELDGTEDYKYRYYVPEVNFSEIYDLRNNAEWVKIEEDDRCDCLTKDYISIRRETIGYGKWLVDMEKGEGMCNKCSVRAKIIYGIRYCPFCGIRVNTEVIRDVKDRQGKAHMQKV